MKPIHFVDTTLRDGNISLWASGMRQHMIEPIIDRLDSVGYKAMEIVDASFFKKAVAQLIETLGKRNFGYMRVEKGSFAVQLGRTA